jgi:hypothetical protein
MRFTRSQLGLSLTSLAMAVALAACGEKSAPDVAGNASAADDSAVASAKSYSLANGPDVCFKAIAQHLGADAKVMEIQSFFSSGSEIDASAKKPAGTLTHCAVDYQDPANPKKLIGTRLDTTTGTFSEPHQIELSVSGDAANFNLEDYLVPLSQVDAGALTSVFDAQKAALEGVYSKFAWHDIRLQPPGPFNDVPVLRVGAEGRLASNDIKKSGFALVSLDGKTIVKNNLLP